MSLVGPDSSRRFRRKGEIFVPKVLRAVLTLLIGIVIFVVLPLVGWGLKGAPTYTSHPARLAYTALAVLLQIVVVIRLPEAGRNRGKGEKAMHRQRLTIVLLQIIPLAIVIAAPYGDRRHIAVLGDVPFVRHLGLVLFFLGFIVMHWAEVALDKQFSVEVAIHQDHRLVTDGPFRHVRHPRYLGIIGFATGISLVFRSWMGLILVAALTLVLLWRIHDEEALMHQEFGTAWEDYCKKSWRLIPFVY